MAYIFGYTIIGEKYYDSGNSENYPGWTALNCDVNESLHLAYSDDAEKFIPLRNNTGILFPQAEWNTKQVGGTTKVMIQPWIFRTKDERFGICAVRRDEDQADSTKKGCILLFFSEDMVKYSEDKFLQVGEKEIHNPCCRWEASKGTYLLEWEEEGKLFRGNTKDFEKLYDKEQIMESSFSKSRVLEIDGASEGNIVEITERESKKILSYLSRIKNVGVEIPNIKTKVNEKIDFCKLPDAKCIYNDGSFHAKRVEWDKKDYDKIDFSKTGVYSVAGKVASSWHDFPFLDFNITDPYVLFWQEQYYLIYLDLEKGTGVNARRGSSLEELKTAPDVQILSGASGCSNTEGCWWAPELHIIDGVPYMFTTVGDGSWNTTKSCIYECRGDILDPEAWSGPHLVVKPDKSLLRPDGVSLDMTYFEVQGKHYVMWSDRQWVDINKQMEPEVQDCANTFIATVNPRCPWELTSSPVCIRKPIYGWERYETKVEEGPFLIRKNGDLFVTISCSSTALADLYCVGILHSTEDRDLLHEESWDWFTYPVLTKESVAGEYGPGHNCFLKEKETGDDLFVYHAVRHDNEQRTLLRYMGIRRVHWGTNGYPYLEMTGEEDMDPMWSKVELKVEIES